MKTGTILFNGEDLSLYGEPQFTVTRTPDPAPPARPEHYRLQFSITMELPGKAPSTTWAKARAIQAIMADTAEGTLEIRDENATSRTWRATPGNNNLSEAIKHGYGKVTLEFFATEEAAKNDLNITVDPLDGSAAITLDRPTSWSQNINVERPDERLGHRSRVRTILSFAARTKYAVRSNNANDRMIELEQEVERIKALSGKRIQISFAGFDKTVQCETLQASPDEAWEYIEITAQCRHVVLPGDTEAEVEFTASSKHDPAIGTTVTSISGSIEAPDESTADAKLDAIIAAYRTAPRRLTSRNVTDRWLDGEDAVGGTPSWAGLNFDIEFTEGDDQARYELKIDTSESADGKRITYSGTAHSADLATLETTIATAAEGKHDVELSRKTTIHYATDDEGNVKIDRADFSYEYVDASEKVRGQITQSNSNPAFGDRTKTVSGNITAPTEARAKEISRSFIPANVCLRTDDEQPAKFIFNNETVGSATNEQFYNLAFTYTWFVSHDELTIQYTDNSSPDYTAMVDNRTIAGTIRATTEAAARTAMKNLLLGLDFVIDTADATVAKPFTPASSSSVTASYEHCGPLDTGTTNWINLEFNWTFPTKLEGEPGHDIIEANWAIERTGMVDHEPMTEIPGSGAKPVAQTNFGYNIGRLVASGTCKARQQATARTWGIAKRAAVASYGGVTGRPDPPSERMNVSFVPFNGEDETFFEFSFTYAFRYHDGLTDNTWPVGLSL